jgi:hypothetical protein
MTRTIGNPVRAHYEVYVDNNRPNAPTIRAEGRLVYDYEYDNSPTYEYDQTPVAVASVGAVSTEFSTTELERRIVVATRRDALWALGMLADREIDFKGNTITIDSFDSADPNASYWASGASFGVYDPTKRKGNGDVASNHDIIDSVSVGNADVMGHVSTGPGGTIAIGPSGSVGSVAWVSGGNSGIQAGYSSDDMNVRLEDVSLPSTTWFTLPDSGKTGVLINGVTYRHVIYASGDYTTSTLHGSVYVAPGVDARVYISDSVSLSAKEEIRINPDAQRLTVYMAGSQFKLGGDGVANETGNAASFLYFGLPSNTTVTFGGNASFTGAIYANHADFVLGGGGDDAYDFVGACVTRTVKMNGHFNFHYDENLANLGPSRGFIPTSWAEL